MEKHIKVNEKYRWFIEYDGDYLMVFLERFKRNHWFWGEIWRDTGYCYAINITGNIHNHLKEGPELYGWINGHTRHVPILEFNKHEDIKLYLVDVGLKYESAYNKRKDEKKSIEKIIENL